MEREVFIIQNVSTNKIELQDFGIIIPSDVSIDLSDFDQAYLSNELDNYLSNEDIVRFINGASVGYEYSQLKTPQKERLFQVDVSEYTVLSEDMGRVIELTYEKPTTIKFPNNLFKGWHATFINKGSGIKTFEGVNGTSLGSREDRKKLYVKYDSAWAYYTDPSNCIITGDLFPNPYFIITVDTTKAGSASNQFILPTAGSGFDAYIDWGDGSTAQYVSGSPGNITKTYDSPGIYQIWIKGSFPRIYFNNGGDRLKLMSIDNWGDVLPTGSQQAAYYGCSNMEAKYEDTPKFGNATNMTYMFRGCTLFNGSVANWDTSQVTSLLNAFSGCTSFNQNITGWDTALVTNMQNMFSGCTSFNGYVDGLNTSSVTSMLSMFYGCTSFNQPVSSWNTANVTSMAQLFRGCTVFNQSVSNFNTAKVTTMYAMFFDCDNFNQSITGWSTPLLTNTAYMFSGCSSFNQSVSSLNTSSVTNMQWMFNGCTVFNQSVSTFDTANVTNMSYMFAGCSAFDQPVNTFNTAKVTSMFNMFYKAYAFNQSLSTWDTGLVTNMNGMLRETAMKQSLASFDMEDVTNITYILYGVDLNDASTSTNYDDTLISWASQSVKPNLSLWSTSKYGPSGLTARNTLTGAPNNWTISDAGAL